MVFIFFAFIQLIIIILSFTRLLLVWLVSSQLFRVHTSVDKRRNILYCIVHIIYTFKSNNGVNKSLYTETSTKETELKVSPWLESVHMGIFAVPFKKSSDF